MGDSASNVMAGHETHCHYIDQMIYAASVVRAAKSIGWVDLPFGSYQGNSKMRWIRRYE